ncbi:MAG: ABC transporter permease [Pseudomonadota bacterium]
MTDTNPIQPRMAEPAIPQAPRPNVQRSFPGMRTVTALMLREMSTTYGRTIGGYIWAVVEPIGVIFLLAFGFSLFIRNPPLGSNFILFYASGYLVFHIYQMIALPVSRSLTFSRPLLFYPAVTWLDAVVARTILNALTGIMVCYVALVIVFVMLETRTVIEVAPLITATLLSIFLGFSLGVTNCALIGLFPTWDVVWSIVTRPLFLASGVLFTYESLPQAVQNILWYNPLLHIVGLFRSGIYPMYQADYVSIAFVAGVATVLSAIGIALLHRNHREILERG